MIRGILVDKDGQEFFKTIKQRGRISGNAGQPRKATDKLQESPPQSGTNIINVADSYGSYNTS